MPRRHLASLAPGSSAWQKLQALAGLNARIRLGQPTVVRELRVGHAELLPGAKTTGCVCALPLAGNCALLASYKPTMHANSPRAVAVGTHSDGALWTQPWSSAVPLFSVRTAFSGDGGFGVVFAPTGTGSSLWTPIPVPGAPLFLVRVFNTQRLQWSADLPVATAKEYHGEVAFSSHTAPPLAAVCGWTLAEEGIVIVVNLQQPSVRVVACGHSRRLVEWRQLQWLPSSHALILLRRDYEGEYQTSLARWDAAGASSAASPPDWVPCVPPEQFYVFVARGQSPIMGLSSCGQQVWTVQMVAHPKIGNLHFALYSTASLSHLGSWCREFSEGTVVDSVHVRHQLLAVCVVVHRGYVSRLHVYALLAKPAALAQELYSLSAGGPAPCFTQDGRHLMTSYLGSVTLRTASKGSCIADLASPVRGFQKPLNVQQAVWSTDYPAQLYIIYTIGDDHLCRVLQF